MATISEVIQPLIGSVTGVDSSVMGLVMACGVVILGLEFFMYIEDFIFLILTRYK